MKPPINLKPLIKSRIQINNPSFLEPIPIPDNGVMPNDFSILFSLRSELSLIKRQIFSSFPNFERIQIDEEKLPLLQKAKEFISHQRFINSKFTSILINCIDNNTSLDMNYEVTSNHSVFSQLISTLYTIIFPFENLDESIKKIFEDCFNSIIHPLLDITDYESTYINEDPPNHYKHIRNSLAHNRFQFGDVFIHFEDVSQYERPPKTYYSNIKPEIAIQHIVVRTLNSFHEILNELLVLHEISMYENILIQIIPST